MSMKTSPQFKSTQPAVSSPDGLHIANYNAPDLEIRQIKSLELVRSIPVPSHPNSRYLCLRWSPVTKGMAGSHRILFADEDTVRVWDLHDSQWSAIIESGTGGMGKIANAEFGSDDTEVLVFSGFGAKLTIWSLWTGHGIDIKDPKFASRGHGRNRGGRTGIFALLTRPGAQDVVSLHAPDSYSVLKTIVVPSTDAQGLKWSPDGRWFAIWDASSTGFKVYIYTSDGNLYRTYNGDYYEDKLTGLGVRSIEWSPRGDCLAIGGYDKSIALLSTRTFSPAVHLAHTGNVRLSAGVVFQEFAQSATERIYNLVSQRLSLPTASLMPGDSQPKFGVSAIAFNANGTYLATKEDSLPTAIWIWDLTRLKAAAVLVQHSTVKRLLWHPTNTDLLMIQCIQGESILYFWNTAENQPIVQAMPNIQISGKAEARWIPQHRCDNSTLMFADAQTFSLAYPQSTDENRSALEQRDSSSGSNGDCPKFNAIDDSPMSHSIEDYHGENETVQDTFHFRHGVNVT